MPVLLLSSLIKSHALTQILRWKSLFGAGKLPQNSCGSGIHTSDTRETELLRLPQWTLCRGGNTGVSGLAHSVTSQQELCSRNVDNKYHTLQLSSLINLFYSLCFDLFKDPNFYTLKIKQAAVISERNIFSCWFESSLLVSLSYLLERELSSFSLFGEL